MCNAHHRRELIFLVEHYGVQTAQAMLDLLLTMKQPTDAMPAGLPPALIGDFERRFDSLVQQGLSEYPVRPRPPDGTGRCAQHPATNLFLRLRDYRDAVLAFIQQPDAPFGNNLAERDLRMMKVKQKIAGGFRTWQGAEIFVAIRSYLSTARKQGISMLEATRCALLGTPFIPTIPLPE